MPIIRPQHARDPWRPLRPWPDDCMVQWGGSGVVLGEAPYATAFFEAFPAAGAGGFIRGEGKTVEEAEAAAFARYEREKGCFDAGGHRWSRARRVGGFEARERKGRRVPKVSTYLNGGAFCLGCGAFSTVMREVHELGDSRRPLTGGEIEALMSGMVRADEEWEARRPERDRVRAARWRRELALRARVAGIDLPDPELPEHRLGKGRNPFADDAYQKGCRRAVARHYLENRDRVPAGTDDVLGGMLYAMTRRRLEEEMADLLAEAG